MFTTWDTTAPSETVWHKSGRPMHEYTTSDVFYLANDLGGVIIDDDSIIVGNARFYGE